MHGTGNAKVLLWLRFHDILHRPISRAVNGGLFQSISNASTKTSKAGLNV